MAKRLREQETKQVSTTPPQWVAGILSTTVFASAFLLFLVQPLICKAILHWFGGTPAVWTTSMFFFQVVLLLGYVYADVTSRYLAPRFQLLLHLALIALATISLPIEPVEAWKPIGNEDNPAWRLLGLLTTTVGLPFFLLSTTAPLLQVWWHRIYQDAPYRLYAVSNTGSLLALFTFPFLVEPNVGVTRQIEGWSTGFFVVSCLLAYCAYAGSIPSHVESKNTSATRLPSGQRLLLWLTLSTCGSVLLLAMTSHITQNVAVVPFLWVAPLGLYLLSFILSFANNSFYRRGMFGGAMFVTFAAVALLYGREARLSLSLLLGVHLLALFAGCMVCHGELARRKPSSDQLTLYFVVISVGGAVGGWFVSILAPAVFANYYEYPTILVICWVVFVAILFRENTSSPPRGRRVATLISIGMLSFCFLVGIRNGVIREATTSFLSRRSFYGVLSVRPYVEQNENAIQLMHGIIRHGAQYLDESKRDEPTSYYRRDSGVGMAMKLVGEKPNKRVGMLGLGIGTIAAYADEDDYFRAYEINPDVVELATNSDAFSFWSLIGQRNARGEIVVGDARFALENEARAGHFQNFDILIMDVFSGDAIPVHLLTIEAFETYFRHLAPHGLLAVHISNRHLDLLPVVQTAATRFPVNVGLVSFPHSEWVIVGSPEVMALLESQNKEDLKLLAPPRDPNLWTDEYSNIFSVLR